MDSRRSRLLAVITAGAALGAITLTIAAGDPAPASGLAVPSPPERALELPPAGAMPTFAVTFAPPYQRVVPGFASPPRAGILIDLGTGRVMWQRAPDRVLPIASLTKMMNALVTVSRATPDRPIRISAGAAGMGGSRVGALPAGRTMPVEALLAGMLIPSGNDAATALAEGLGPGRARFVARMNARAREMGLGCTRFESPTGLAPGDRSCARDLARIAAGLLAQPRLARIVQREWQSIGIPGGKRVRVRNRNPLVQAHYPGISGIKTGHTALAGFSLAASAARPDGRVLLGVLLASPDTGRQMRALFDRGFDALGR